MKKDLVVLTGVELLGFRSRKASVRLGTPDVAIIDTDLRAMRDGDWYVVMFKGSLWLLDPYRFQQDVDWSLGEDRSAEFI